MSEMGTYPNLQKGGSQRSFTWLILQAIVLLQKPICRAELQRKLRLNNAATARYIAELKAKQLIYTAFWRRNDPTSGGNYVEYLCWGYKHESAPKPRAATNAEYCRRWRQKKAKQEHKAKLLPLEVSLQGVIHE